jgi:hypothetical protein
MTKIAGSGSFRQKHGSEDQDADPDPPQNIMDTEHWLPAFFIKNICVHIRALAPKVRPLIYFF